MTTVRRCSIPSSLLAGCLLLVCLASCSLIDSSSPQPDTCLLRNDYQNLPRPRLVGPRSHYRSLFRQILSGFIAGSGDRYSTTLAGDKTVILPEWLKSNGADINAHAIWLTRRWDESWLSRSDLEDMARNGVIPVLVLYYFADDISREVVLKHRQDWYFYLMKVAALASIDYPVLVVLEPEFNDESNDDDTLVLAWGGFNEVVIDGIYILRSLAPNILVGVCPGDFGDSQDIEYSAGEAVQYSDFVAFQEMRASTQTTLVNDTFEDVTGRALSYSHRLSEKFDKPVLLAYAAVSTYSDGNGDWHQYQADILDNLFTSVPELRSNRVFGILNFMLFDDPEHVGYFEEAEPFFGLVDSAGSPKPGWRVFKKHISALQGILTKL